MTRPKSLDANRVHFCSKDLPAGSPDGSDPMDYYWLTAPWRVCGLPPVVRLEHFTGRNRMMACIQAYPPGHSVRSRTVSVRSLEHCGADLG